MRPYLCVILASLISLISCKEDPKKTVEYAQMQRILSLHDEVMPEMSTISKHISVLESVFWMDSTQIALGESIEELKGANQAMMQWMMDFSEVFSTEEIMGKEIISSDKRSLLEDYESAALALKKKMLGAIERADSLKSDSN